MITTLVLATLLTSQVKPEAAKLYSELLAKYVKDGRVDYKGLAEKDLKKLDTYVEAVGSAPVPADKMEAIAFYTDAYNALVLKSVIANKRPRSVLDVKDFFDAKIHKVAGKTLSLNQLEKEVLNPMAQDPRTHMVLVCAAVGCPILENAPYTGSAVEQRLDAATRRYLGGKTGLAVEPGKIELSKIFDWYSKDFGGEAGVVAFVKKHVPPETAAKIGDKPKVTYFDYNWTLNQQ